jgi:hypothetical protein
MRQGRRPGGAHAQVEGADDAGRGLAEAVEQPRDDRIAIHREIGGDPRARIAEQPLGAVEIGHDGQRVRRLSP